MAKVHTVVTVVNGNVLEELISINSCLVDPYQLDKGLLSVQQFFPKSGTAVVIPEKGNARPFKVDTSKTVMVYSPEKEISPEFSKLMISGSSEFPDIFRSLYLDVIEEKEPEFYEHLMGNKIATHAIATKEDVELSSSKICATCGVEFETKAHNAKYCPEHRTAAARKAYVAPEPEVKDVKPVPEVIDLSVMANQEAPTSEVKTEIPAIKVDHLGRVIANKGDRITYYAKDGGKIEMEVLDVKDHVFSLRRLDTGSTGELSRAIKNWIDAEARAKRAKQAELTRVTDAIEFIGRAGIPEIYQGKGITVDSILIKKNGVEARYVVNKSKKLGTDYYVRQIPFTSGGYTLTAEEASYALTLWRQATA